MPSTPNHLPSQRRLKMEDELHLGEPWFLSRAAAGRTGEVLVKQNAMNKVIDVVRFGRCVIAKCRNAWSVSSDVSFRPHRKLTPKQLPNVSGVLCGQMWKARSV